MSTIRISQLKGQLRPISQPNFTVEPWPITSQFQRGRYRFVYAWVGMDGKYAGLSPETDATLVQSGPIAIRIPGQAGVKAVGFVPFFMWLDAPDPTWRTVWFPCSPAGGTNRWFHFAPGDRRWAGQLLNINPWNPATGSAPQHWTYPGAFPQGARGWDGSLLVDPVVAPTITVHSQIPPGSYFVGLSYAVGNSETPMSLQPITLTNQGTILIHRNEQPPIGAKGMFVYLGRSTAMRNVPAVDGSLMWPLNWCTFWIGTLPPAVVMPTSKLTTQYQSDELDEALLGNYTEIIIDKDLNRTSGVILPLRSDLRSRWIHGDGSNPIITVSADCDNLTVCCSYTRLEDFQIHGGKEWNYCDPTGSGAFMNRFTRMNIWGQGYSLFADDAGATGKLDADLMIVHGHTASEQQFEDCYFQGQHWLSGNQTVTFFFRNHRQDVNVDNTYPLESAALHAKGNKFIVFETYYGVNGNCQSLFNIDNVGGDVTVDVSGLYIDGSIPMLFAKGAQKSATLSLNTGNVNVLEIFGLVPNGSMILKLDGFIKPEGRVFAGVPGSVTVLAIDPAEKNSVQVITTATS